MLVTAGQADYQIANKIYQRSQYREAIPYLERSAYQNYPPAFLKLGRIYQNGDCGVHKDEKKSVEYFQRITNHLEWFRQNAKSLNPDDVFDAGLFCCYATKNDTMKVEYYQIAAALGHPSAQCNLAISLERGNGIPKDQAAAIEYYQKATNNGSALAANNLGVCYQKGRGVTICLETAKKYYQKSADQGFSLAQRNLALLIYETDMNESFKYFKSSADQGYAIAQMNVGQCYRDGTGVDKNENLSTRYFEMAWDGGCESGWLFVKEGYVVGSRSDCYELMRYCLPILINTKGNGTTKLLLPEIWMMIVVELLTHCTFSRLEAQKTSL